MNKEISTKVQFKKPYYIEVLGEEGLTARDIADALDINLFHAHEKIKREQKESKSLIFKYIVYTFYNENNLLVETYAMNIMTAKAFVARWKNHIGDSYLKFLFECEKVATELMPLLLDENKLLKEKLSLAEYSAIKNSKKLLKKQKQGLILAPVYERNIFDLMELRWEMRQKETLDEISKLKAEIRHNQKVMKGLVNSALDKQEKLDRRELAKKNNLIKLVTD